MIRRFLSRGDAILLLWAFFLLCLWVLGWAVFDPDPEHVMLAISSGALVLWALCAFLRARTRPVPSDEQPVVIPTTTHATALVGVAIAGVALAFEFGPWLMYISGGLLGIAIAGLIRERLAIRKLLGEIAQREREAAAAVLHEQVERERRAAGDGGAGGPAIEERQVR